MCERELETEQNCNILTPTLMAIRVCVFIVLQSCSNGGPVAQLSAECWPSLPHLVSNFWSPKLTDFLSSPSYIIVQSPTQSLGWHVWSSSSGNNCHAFTGHSLPVHQSMTVPQDFTLSHIVSHTCPRQWNMHFRRLWNGMFGWVEGQYTTR